MTKYRKSDKKCKKRCSRQKCKKRCSREKCKKRCSRQCDRNSNRRIICPYRVQSRYPNRIGSTIFVNTAAEAQIIEEELNFLGIESCQKCEIRYQASIAVRLACIRLHEAAGQPITNCPPIADCTNCENVVTIRPPPIEIF